MRFSLVAVLVGASAVNAAYPGDIVQYWYVRAQCSFPVTSMGLHTNPDPDPVPIVPTDLFLPPGPTNPAHSSTTPSSTVSNRPPRHGTQPYSTAPFTRLPSPRSANHSPSNRSPSLMRRITLSFSFSTGPATTATPMLLSALSFPRSVLILPRGRAREPSRSAALPPARSLRLGPMMALPILLTTPLVQRTPVCISRLRAVRRTLTTLKDGT